MVLRGLGEKFPNSSGRIVLRTVFELQNLRRRLKRKTSESLLRIPDMTDIHKSEAMSLLNLLFMYLFLNRRLLAPLAALRLVKLSLDYGLCATSSVGFTLLGGILCG